MGDPQTRSGGLRDHAPTTGTDPVTVVHDLAPDAVERTGKDTSSPPPAPPEHRWVTEWSQ